MCGTPLARYTSERFTLTQEVKTMNLSKEEAIKEACSIVALAYRSIGDYRHASDGFCQTCKDQHGPAWGFANQGFTLDYVRQAVVAALKRDGFTIHKGFDPETGKELTP
jgi:hypothetical protein